MAAFRQTDCILLFANMTWRLSVLITRAILEYHGCQGGGRSSYERYFTEHLAHDPKYSMPTVDAVFSRMSPLIF